MLLTFHYNTQVLTFAPMISKSILKHTHNKIINNTVSSDLNVMYTSAYS